MTESDLARRLVQRISRRYDVMLEQLQFPSLRLDFLRVSDPDVVLDQVAAEEDRRERATGQRHDGDELHLPYWAQLWDSAIGMAHYLCTQGVIGRSVLDLGCGMGLSGTVAAALGASVTFADLESAALLFAAWNSLPWRGRVRTHRLNWRTDDLAQRFDLILGADILYERAQWEFLDHFFRRHLAQGATVLLGEPGRQTGENFVPWITRRGWTIDLLAQAIPQRPKPINLFRLTCPPASRSPQA